MEDCFILKGNILWSKSLKEIAVVSGGLLVCDCGLSGGVFSCEKDLPTQFRDYPVHDCGDLLIIPGMTDLHVHAPQYTFRGLGMDMELLDWLNLNAFPEETRYKDLEYADKAYTLFADDLKQSATTNAVVFATVHVPATLLLMDKLEKTGLRTYVGKVNMDRNSPEGLQEESAEKSIKETERWIRLCLGEDESVSHDGTRICGSEMQDSNPQDSKPQDSNPQDSKPQDSNPQDSKPQDSNPQDSKPQDSNPQDSKPQDSNPQDSKPQDSNPQDSKPQDCRLKAGRKDAPLRFRNTRPILTPRFIPSCSDELMEGLGELRRKYDLQVQSHLSENLAEIEWVKTLCPESGSYVDAYDRFGVLGEKAVMAHCVYNTDEELRILKERGTYIAHCPQSNTNIASGIAPVRRYLDENMHVGLGTDIAGGSSLSMFRAMVDAISVSKLRWRLADQSLAPLTLEEAFYLATAGGGAFFGRTGSFEEGYEFDALVIDDRRYRTARKLSARERLERFVYLSGGTQDITEKYVSGIRII